KSPQIAVLAVVPIVSKLEMTSQATKRKIPPPVSSDKRKDKENPDEEPRRMFCSAVRSCRCPSCSRARRLKAAGATAHCLLRPQHALRRCRAASGFRRRGHAGGQVLLRAHQRRVQGRAHFRRRG